MATMGRSGLALGRDLWFVKVSALFCRYVEFARLYLTRGFSARMTDSVFWTHPYLCGAGKKIDVIRFNL